MAVSLTHFLRCVSEPGIAGYGVRAALGHSVVLLAPCRPLQLACPVGTIICSSFPITLGKKWILLDLCGTCPRLCIQSTPVLDDTVCSPEEGGGFRGFSSLPESIARKWESQICSPSPVPLQREGS